MPKVFDYKFLLPPVILALFLISAHPVFLLFILQINSLSTIFSAVAVLFAVGFVISTFGYAVINMLGDFPKPKEELLNWIRIGKRGDFVQTQILKRWDIIALNVNSIVAASFVLLVTLNQNWCPSPLWWVIILLFIACLFYNVQQARRSPKIFEETLEEKYPDLT